MTLLTVTADFMRQSNVSVSTTSQDQTPVRVEDIATSTLSPPETASVAPLKRDYSSKNGVMWDCIGSRPAAENKGEIYTFKLKAAYNALLKSDTRSATKETFDKIFPALEFVPNFTSKNEPKLLKCLRLKTSPKALNILEELGYRCELKEKEFYLYVPDVEALQAGWERCCKAHPGKLSPIKILPSFGTASDRAIIDAFYTHDILMSMSKEMMHDQVHLRELVELQVGAEGNYTQTKESIRTLIKLCGDLPLQEAISHDSALPYRHELETLISILIDNDIQGQIADLKRKHLPNSNVAVLLPAGFQCECINRGIKTVLFDPDWWSYLSRRYPLLSNDDARIQLAQAWDLMQTKFFLAQAKISMGEDDLKEPQESFLPPLDGFPESLAVLAEYNLLNQKNWDFLKQSYPSFLERKDKMHLAAGQCLYKSLNTQENRDKAFENLAHHKLDDESARQILTQSLVPLHSAYALIHLASKPIPQAMKNDLFFQLELERFR